MTKTGKQLGKVIAAGLFMILAAGFANNANAQSFYKAVFTAEKSGKRYAIHVYGPVLSDKSYDSSKAREMLALFKDALRSQKGYSNVNSYDGKAMIIRENANGKKFENDRDAKYRRNELYDENNIKTNSGTLFDGAIIVAEIMGWE